MILMIWPGELQDKGFKDLLLYRGGMEDWLEKGNAVAR